MNSLIAKWTSKWLAEAIGEGNGVKIVTPITDRQLWIVARASEGIHTRESRKPYILFLKIKNEMEISKAALQYTLSCFSTSAKVSAELLKSAVDF